jgi:cell division protein FtsZ
MAIEMIEEFDLGTQIKVIGVGGGGGNAVEHMISQKVQNVEFICANTDAQALNRSTAAALVQLGTKGLGAGGKPEVGRAAAESAVDSIRSSIDGAHMLFITAGMGGGTGTGAASVIARVAREMGILTVGVVTKPFEFEGNRRAKQADAGVAELEENVDSLIVVLNEKLLEVMGDDVTQEAAFAHANDVLKNAVGGISDIIHMDALVNVDFEDVKTVMSGEGDDGHRAGGPRATKAAEQAARPLLEGIDLSGARGVLVLIAASKATFKLAESRNAMNTIRRYAADDAHVIFGTAYDETLGDQLGDVDRTGLIRPARAGTDQRRPQCARAAHRHRQPAADDAGGRRCGAGRSAGPRLQQPLHAERLAQQPQRIVAGRCARQQRHGRDRDPGLPAASGGLIGSACAGSNGASAIPVGEFSQPGF